MSGIILVDAQSPKICSWLVIRRGRRRAVISNMRCAFAMKVTKIIVHTPYPIFFVRSYPMPKAAFAASAANVTSPRLYVTAVEIPDILLGTATVRYPK